MADLEGLQEIVQGTDIHLIEDAAQSVGAEDRGGNRAGSIGTVGCFSFFPAKNLELLAMEGNHNSKPGTSGAIADSSSS